MNPDKKPAKNAIFVYQKPIAKQAYAESVTIKRWAELYAGDQYTIYRGLKDDLIAVGVAPAQIFRDVGRSGTKRARILHDDGEKRTIEISKRARGIWEVLIYHNKNALPYSSPKAVCSEKNDGTTTPPVNSLPNTDQPDSEQLASFNPQQFRSRGLEMVAMAASVAIKYFGGDYEVRRNGVQTHRISNADMQKIIATSEQLINVIKTVKVESVKASDRASHLRIVKSS